MSNRQTSRIARCGRRERRGLSILAVLVLCAVIGALTASMIRTAATVQRTVRRELSISQCRWLVEAAQERAVAKLQNEADYTGEVWQLTSEQLGGHPAAEIDIRIVPADEDAAPTEPNPDSLVLVSISAVMAKESPERVQQEHSLLVRRR